MELAINCFIRTLRIRMEDYVLTVKGKYDDECFWHYFLVDWGKKDKFLEEIKTGEVNLLKYGQILDSGWGHDIPRRISAKSGKFVKDLLKSFFLLRFETDGCLQNFYVLSDAGKELDMEVASSVEDIRECGTILYSSFDEDPPEALACILEAKYFGLDSKFSLNVGSPFDAVINRGLQNVQEYLNSGRGINCTDYRGWKLLHYFAHYGEIEILTFLKSKGANFHVRDKICGRKPVHIAAREGHEKSVDFFLKNGSTVNEVDDNNWTLLHYASWKGNVKTVRLLIENYAEINAKDLATGKNPIHLAAEYGHTDVIEVFLENNAGIEEEDIYGIAPLYYAALRGNLETAKFLIDKGADIHKKAEFGIMPIHAVVTYKNNKKVLDLFLTLGVNVDERDCDGNTPLHYAVSYGYLDLVQFLIDKKANLNIVNNSGKKPIDFCKENTDLFLYLADIMVKVFQEQEKYNDALKCCRDMLKIQEEKLGLNHPETLKTLYQEAKCLYKQGQYDAAVSSFKRVLETRGRCLGDNHIDTLDTKHGLSLAYFAQMKYHKAIEIFKEVYEKRQASVIAYQLDTLNIARDLAYVHIKNGKHDEAFKIFEDVFEKRAHFGEDHPNTLQAKQEMAAVHFDKASNSFERCFTERV